jgi:hypothetical protein
LDDIQHSQRSVSRLDSDVVKSGVLFCKFKGKSYIIIDPILGEKLVNDVHKNYGHVGIKHVMLILQKHFHFHGMSCII